MAKCRLSLDSTKRQPFGPPSQWELFNAVCKTACRSYTDRVERIRTATDCDCALFNPPSCPMTTTDLLCKVVQFCYESGPYQRTYCDDHACGRQATNEDTWRNCFGITE